MGNRGAGARSGPELGAGLVENVGKNLRGLQRGVQLRMCNERSPRGMPGVLCAIWVSLLSARPMRCVHCAMESRFAARPAVYFTGVTLDPWSRIRGAQPLRLSARALRRNISLPTPFPGRVPFKGTRALIVAGMPPELPCRGPRPVSAPPWAGNI